MRVPALVTSLLVLLLPRAASVQQESQTSLQLVQRQLPRSDGDVLLVTLLDGHVVAVDHPTGRILWTFDSGAPLVSAKQTAALSQGMNVFPGTDGGLYAYHGMKQLSPGLERLPISLPELVDAAPSLTSDGSIILGRRESKVYVLDKRSGRGVSTISNTADALEDHSGALGLSMGVTREHLLLMGRQDYIVRSVRVDSKAETWNATFSRMFMLSGDAGSIKEFLQHGAPPVLGAERKQADLPRLVVGSDNSLQAFDSNTMDRKWYIAFDTPPVSAYRQDGSGGNCLDPDQAMARAALRPTGGLMPVTGSPARPGKWRGQLSGGTNVLVGALKGSLYALPADHLMLAADSEGGVGGGAGAVVWPDRVGSMPLDINPADKSGICNVPGSAGAVQPAGNTARPPQLPASPQSVVAVIPQDGSSNSAACNIGASAVGPGSSCNPSAVVLFDDSSSRGAGGELVPLEPADSDVLLDELGSLTCPQPPLGIHAVSRQQQQAVTWLPNMTEPAAAKKQRHYPKWLNLRFILGSIIALLLLPLLFRLRPLYNGSPSKAVAMHSMQPQPTASLNGTAAPSKKNKPKHKKKSTPPPADIVADSAINSDVILTAAPAASEGVSQLAVNGDLQHQDQLQSPQQLQQQQEIALAGDAASRTASRALSAAGSYVGSLSASPSPEPGSLSPVPVGGSSGGVSEGGGGSGQLASRSYVDEDGAVVIGRLRVGPGILGYGSAGTIVYEGVLDSRPVAVKRLLRQFYNLARKEIQVLVVSDEHPNVVRCFAMEEDREFVYLALERCKTSLSDTMSNRDGQAAMQDPASGCPTPWCLSVLSDIAAGLAALHARQIVHRDLKPHNVLLTEAGRAKLSDMGLSKQLVSEQSSFESHGSGGSSGWQAPEQLIAKDGGAVRQSRAVDVFSLGCIMFYCVTGGKHPFGEHYERDTNIMKGCSCLSPLAGQPEAFNLISAMLSKSPAARPSMSAVLGHPFWWTDEQKLQFLVDVSDRVENEDREPDPTLLNALESFSTAAVGSNWGAGLDAELIANLGKYRRYDYTCLRDLLRVVRNKRNHFREMPESLQQLLGPVPDGYYRYFSSRFPTLLMAVFFFALKHLDQDPNLAKYWAVGQHQYVPFQKPWERMTAAAAGPGPRSRASRGSAARRNSGSGLSRMAPSPLPPAAPVTPVRPAATAAAPTSPTAVASAAAAAAPVGSPPVISFAKVVMSGTAAMGAANAAPAATSSTGGSVTSSAGVSAAVAAVATANGVHDSDGPPVVGYEVAEGEEELHTPMFPSRPGKQTCDFYVKTGHCKYGEECVFDHPAEYAVQLTEQGLPFRAGQPICTFYQKTQQCKFGPSCKFHHPKLIPIYAGSAIQQ